MFCQRVCLCPKYMLGAMEARKRTSDPLKLYLRKLNRKEVQTLPDKLEKSASYPCRDEEKP